MLVLERVSHGSPVSSLHLICRKFSGAMGVAAKNLMLQMQISRLVEFFGDLLGKLLMFGHLFQDLMC